MGNDSSKSYEEPKENGMDASPRKGKAFGTIHSSSLNGDNLSTYSGLKSETQSAGESIDKANTASTLRQEQISQHSALKDGKVATVFEWTEGGKMVYITGSFCSWTQFFIMARKPNGFFQLVLNLPRGVYQYKFKVDNQWRYNSTSPTISDNENNVNNIINTTVVAAQIPFPREEDTVSDEVKNAKIKSKDVYGCYYPGKLEMNTDAPGVPLKFYSNLFNLDLNSKQWLLGNQEFLHQAENNLLSENNSSKALARSPHISVSHLIYQYNNPKTAAFETVCHTSRLRQKMLSFVYYKPRPKRFEYSRYN